MLECWDKDPNNRPNFQNLNEALHEMVGCKEITQVYDNDHIIRCGNYRVPTGH